MNYCLWHLHAPAPLDKDGDPVDGAARPEPCPTRATSSYARVSYCDAHAKEAERLDVDPIADECDNDPDLASPADAERVAARAKRRKGGKKKK